MKFAVDVVLGNAALFTIVVGGALFTVVALAYAAVVGELRDIFETPQEKEKD